MLSLPHNHIVRTVDISPSGSRVITAGQEKKLRLFDLDRPEEPEYFTSEGSQLAHDGNIKSIVYDEPHQQIISVDDRVLK